MVQVVERGALHGRVGLEVCSGHLLMHLPRAVHPGDGALDISARKDKDRLRGDGDALALNALVIAASQKTWQLCASATN